MRAVWPRDRAGALSVPARLVASLWLVGALLACMLLLVMPRASCGFGVSAASPAGSDVVTLAAMGDVMLGRGVAEGLEGDWGAAFASVRPWLAGADVALANLESPLTNRPSAAGEDLRADPAAVSALQSAGFDVVSLANNHARDAGQAGLDEAVAALEAAGIAAIGADEAAYTLWDEPALCGLAFDDSLAPLDVARAAEAVAAAAGRADIVVVSIHWGGEYQATPSVRQRAVASALAESGADLIVGHGPHTLQPLQWVGSTLVAYSLGNGLFDQLYPRDLRWGAILQVTFQEGTVVGLDAVPTVAEGGRVLLAGATDGVTIRERLDLAHAQSVLADATLGDMR